MTVPQSEQPQQSQQPPPSEPPTQPPQSQPVTEQKNRNFWWIVGLVAVIGICMGLALVLFRGNDSGGSTGGTEVIPPTPIPGAPSATALEDINIRSGPGTNYPVYGVAPAGSTSEVVGKSQDGFWWVIKVPTTVSGNGQGWVSADYVQVSNAETVAVIPTPPPPPVVEIPPPAPGAPSATALEAVNVRSGPGTEYPAYGVAPKGATGEVVGVSENRIWFAVKLPTTIAPEGYGWVSSDWVSVDNIANVPVLPPPNPEPPVNPDPPTTGAPTAIAIDYVNVRSGPGTQYSSYGVVPPGSSAEILGKSTDGQWWAIKMLSVPSGRGWVSAGYVQAYNADNVPVITEP
jgi:uncharacterized protein YraI